MAQAQAVTEFVGNNRLEIELARADRADIGARVPIPAPNDRDLTRRGRHTQDAIRHAPEHTDGSAVEDDIRIQANTGVDQDDVGSEMLTSGTGTDWFWGVVVESNDNLANGRN